MNSDNNEESMFAEESEEVIEERSEPLSKLKKNDVVEFEDLDGKIVQARVTSRAGKATAKFKDWYNFQDINSTNVYVEDINKLKNLKFLYNEDRSSNTEIYVSEDVFSKAKSEELASWKQNRVYEEVSKDEVKSNILQTTWVCNMKNEKPKARLVVRGYQEDTSNISKESPTSNKETIRLLMVIAATKDWILKALDVKAAFLQGAEFVRKVYILPPKEAQVGTDRIWKLLKCVYGLSDASLTWYNTLKALFLDLKGKIGIDPGLFFWSKDEIIIGFVSIHVDDFIYAGTADFEKNVVTQIKSSFNIRLEQSKCFQFLGINITQDEGVIKVDQNAFVKNLEIAPLTVDGRNVTDSLTAEEFKVFQSTVGKILWVGNQTRPDVNFDTCMLGSSMKDAKLADYKKCIKILRSLKNNDNSLMLRSIGDINSIKVILYSDASLNNLDKGGSQGGYLIFIAGNNQLASLITWSSKRLKRVVRSTIESETMALAEGLEHCLYLVRILKLLLQLDNICIECRCDNKSLCEAVQSEKEVHNKRLALEIYNLKHLISNDNVSITWIKKNFQLADILTKNGVCNDALMNTLKNGIIELEDG